ncbi:hypothetical protein IPH25_00020 [bacterium]|nr:MAG: hypothetical protein IPG37_02130 [bacterium]QQR61820.1 MAG: hypothetical protein IPH25_00020 [bacterium]QQR62597.1 MAG: hypothetical protein IPH67_04235 [bacterium]
MMIFLLLLFSASIYAMEDLKPLGYRLNEIDNNRSKNSNMTNLLLRIEEDDSKTRDCHKPFIRINNLNGNCYVKAKYVFLVYSDDSDLKQSKDVLTDQKESIDVIELDENDTNNKLISAENKAVFIFLSQFFSNQKIVLNESCLTFCLTILKNPEQNVEKLKDTIRLLNRNDQANVQKVIVSDNIGLLQSWFEKIKPNGDNDPLSEINFKKEFNLKKLSLETSNTDRKPIKTAEELYQDYLSEMTNTQKNYFNNGIITEKNFKVFHWIIPNKNTQLQIQDTFVQNILNKEDNIQTMVTFLKDKYKKESKEQLSLILDKLSEKNQQRLIKALQTKYQDLFIN